MEQNNRNNRLRELSGSDYEMAEGDPDIRGWDVRDASGNRVGEVDELLFDEQSRKVRYIVLDIEGEVIDGEDRDVLVPIGMAQLHSNDDDVILNGVTIDQIRSLPAYEEDNFTPDFENRIRSVFAGGVGAAGAGVATHALDSDREKGNEFYDHEHFNDQNLYRNRQSKTTDTTIPVIKEELQVGKREVESGGVRLRSRIVEKEVQEDITLREEHVHVEKVPVNRPASNADLREETIEMTERTEVPVVAKEARVVEEVKLTKDVEEREEVISDTVRETKVDIDQKNDLDRNDEENRLHRNS